MNRYLIVGGAGLAGVGVLAMLMRQRSQPSAALAPAAPALSIPPYPNASIQEAPINISETPFYMQYNQPFSRDLLAPNVSSDAGDKCKCDDGCNNATVVSSFPPLSNASRRSFFQQIASVGTPRG